MDKPKFNIMDGFITLLLVLIIAVGVFVLRGMWSGNTSGGGGTNTNAVFKIQITKAEKALADKFNQAYENGETVWIGVKERFEGKIQAVDIAPAAKMTTDLTRGQAYLAEDPTSFDVTVTVKAAAVETENAISASGTNIRVGDEALIRGKGIAGYGFIISLETANE